MALFAVISLSSDHSLLREAIERKFPTTNLAISNDHWIISAPATTQDMVAELGAADGKVGHVIIYNVSGYNGWAPNSIWEWARANWSGGNG